MSMSSTPYIRCSCGLGLRLGNRFVVLAFYRILSVMDQPFGTRRNLSNPISVCTFDEARARASSTSVGWEWRATAWDNDNIQTLFHQSTANQVYTNRPLGSYQDVDKNSNLTYRLCAVRKQLHTVWQIVFPFFYIHQTSDMVNGCVIRIISIRRYKCPNNKLNLCIEYQQVIAIWQRLTEMSQARFDWNLPVIIIQLFTWMILSLCIFVKPFRKNRIWYQSNCWIPQKFEVVYSSTQVNGISN